MLSSHDLRIALDFSYVMRNTTETTGDQQFTFDRNRVRKKTLTMSLLRTVLRSE
jgi:hypothetical protein